MSLTIWICIGELDYVDLYISIVPLLKLVLNTKFFIWYCLNFFELHTVYKITWRYDTSPNHTLQCNFPNTLCNQTHPSTLHCNCRVNIPHTLYCATHLATFCSQNIPDHNSRQQLGLSHSLLLVSAAPGHFVWSHQWHQICTAERQPLVGGRQGRGLQQWPGWTLFLRSLEFRTLAICSSYLTSCTATDSQTNYRCFYSFTYLWNLIALRHSEIWLVEVTHTHMVIFGKPFENLLSHLSHLDLFVLTW